MNFSLHSEHRTFGFGQVFDISFLGAGSNPDGTSNPRPPAPGPKTHTDALEYSSHRLVAHEGDSV